MSSEDMFLFANGWNRFQFRRDDSAATIPIAISIEYPHELENYWVGFYQYFFCHFGSVKRNWN